MRLSQFISALGWASLFGLSWLIIVGRITWNFSNGFFWGFFLVAALVSGFVSVTPLHKKG